MQLTKTETVFLDSLSASELEALLEALEAKDREAVRKQLTKWRQDQGREIPTRAQTDLERGLEQARRSNEIHRRQRRAAQDISPLPLAPAADDLLLRFESDNSLLRHLELCYPGAFTLEWSEDHRRLIGDIESACDSGLLKALAMTRGSGKTTIIVRAALWALLTKRRRFCVIIAATQDAASNLLATIKAEILNNMWLHRLYPQELYAMSRLEGESRLAGGQRYDGNLTNVEWRESRINFGYIPEVESSGAMLAACGLTGNLRGQQITLPSGDVLRPDIVLVDDFQTKESAASPSQCQKRHEIMMADVLGLAGPDQTIAALATGTVIFKGDAMDRLLDHKLSPMWNGDRCSLVYKWPDDQTGWDEYRGLLEAELARGGDGSESAEFVRANYDRLHKGSEVGWEHRKGPHDVSALHYAYRLRFRDEVAFWSEGQNLPMSSTVDQPYELAAQELQVRTNQSAEWEIPPDVERITGFVDVQKRCLYWMLVGWEMCGRGHVLSYGVYPDQRRLHFNKRDITRDLERVTKTNGLAESIYAGLENLIGYLMGQTFIQPGGRRGDAVMTIGRLGIDARWGDTTDLVRRFCRESKYLGSLTPYFGHYIGAKSKPWQQWTHQKRDILGNHCKMVPPPRGRGVREMLVDVNWWKTQAAEKLSCHRGADHAILLYKAGPHVHRMVSEHWSTEESRLEVAPSGAGVIEWRAPNTGQDVDFWDCLVGSTVLSTLEGVRIDPRAPIRRSHPQTVQETKQKEAATPNPTPGPRYKQGGDTDDRVSDAQW